MTTLIALADAYANAPKMREAISWAIHKYGKSAEAIIVYGQVSTRKGSNCREAANRLGWEQFEVIPCAARRYRSEGFKNVVIKVP